MEGSENETEQEAVRVYDLVFNSHEINYTICCFVDFFHTPISSSSGISTTSDNVSADV